MKVLVLNGSPRRDGDTVYIINKLIKQFPHNAEFTTLNAFDLNIRPCDDCRYCWKHGGCCIKDQMSILLEDSYDILVLASPLYMSFITPPLFSIISRLNVIWANHCFLNTPNTLKAKKGILILTGGGDGSPNPAISIVKTAFHFLNADFDPASDYIHSLKTNTVPVRDDPDVNRQIENTIKHMKVYLTSNCK